MLKCAVQVMRWRDTRAHRPAICTRNRCIHYVQFNEQPLLAEASTILDRSLSHTYAHSAIMVSQAIWPQVRNFRIDPHDSIMSDHSLLITELNLPSQRPHPQTSDTTPSPLLKFNWTPEAIERLKLRLASPAFQLQIRILEACTKAEDPNIDTLVQDFSNLLLEETKQTVQF